MMLGAEVHMTLSRKQIIDIKEKASLNRLVIGNSNATYIVSDYIDYEYNERYDLVIS